jgi:hypothetical protein
MEVFDKQNCIRGIDNTLHRVIEMKDKVKVLLTLDKYEDMLDTTYFKYIYSDDEVYKKYMELVWKWYEIHDSLTEKELNKYVNLLPVAMENDNWSRETRELFEKRLEEAKEWKLSQQSNL